MSSYPEYFTWIGIKDRCYNKNCPRFSDYGGRGITVCETWVNSFVDFLVDMGRKPSKNHSIDRINVDGNYSFENCRWATRKEQSRNTRKTKYLTNNGITKPITEWAEELDISVTTLKGRLKLGWSVEETLTKPRKEQKYYEYNNEIHNLSEWSKITGIHRNTLEARLKRGWDIQKTLTMTGEKWKKNEK